MSTFPYKQNFFSGESRVSLSSSALWQACKKICSNSEVTNTKIPPCTLFLKKVFFQVNNLGPLWNAHDDVIGRLDDLHQAFLLQRQRKESDIGQVLQQCLL